MKEIQSLIDILNRCRVDPSVYDQLGAEDRQILTQWVDLHPENRAFLDAVLKGQEFTDEQVRMLSVYGRIEARVLETLHQNNQQSSRKVKMIWMAGAAAVACTVIVAGWLWRQPNNNPNTPQQMAAVLPGKDRASLTLPSGEVVDLETVKDTSVAGFQLFNSAGSLRYEDRSQPEGTTIAYSTLRVPKAGRYKIILQDGTKVYLNAASTLRFPTAFRTTREVELTGEGYFEVAKDAQRPFKVKVSQPSGVPAQITVLGTHFNVNAYPERKVIRTTLLEGSVSVASENAERVLQPGQQSVSGAAGLSVSKPKYLPAVTAWKDGVFDFADQPLIEVLEEIGRWYDVEIEIKGGNMKLPFSSTFPKEMPLKDVLVALNGGEAKVELKGRKLIVQ